MYTEHPDTVYTTARYRPAYTIRGNWNSGGGGKVPFSVHILNTLTQYIQQQDMGLPIQSEVTGIVGVGGKYLSLYIY